MNVYSVFKWTLKFNWLQKCRIIKSWHKSNTPQKKNYIYDEALYFMIFSDQWYLFWLELKCTLLNSKKEKGKSFYEINNLIFQTC